jgi:hypothetical protein
MINLMNQSDRLNIIREIEGPENKARKAISLREYEIFNDRQHQYVLDYLRSQFSEKTVQEMPVISSINLCRRIVKQESSLYKAEPIRKFYNVKPETESVLQDMYDVMGYNERFKQSNEYFKLQSQAHLQWVLKDGVIKPRVLLPHHLDVIPKSDDPEQGSIYIISVFDKSTYIRDEQTLRGAQYQGLQGDGVNQKIGDANDYKAKLKKYYVWSDEFNFVMDYDGNITSEETENPLGGILPIIDISGSKDFEYWIRQGQSVADFSIQFNGLLSDVANVVRMQGWGQAVYSGPEGLLPENLVLGPTRILRLPVDPNNPTPTDFKYVNANADIEGSLNFLKTNLSMFLSSRGIDPGSISTDGTSKGYSSGLDRLLDMITKFEASKSDMSIFKKVESQSFEIIKAYVNTYSGSDLLDMEIGTIPDDAYLQVQYAEPQLIKSEQEKLADIEKKRELGLLSRVQAYMDLYGVDEETAVKELAEINGEA